MASYPLTTSLKVIKELQYVKEIAGAPGITPPSPIFTAIPTETFNPKTRKQSIKYTKLGTTDLNKSILNMTNYDFRIGYSPLSIDLLESMINLTGPNSREDTFTFLFSQQHNQSGTLTEMYQIAKGCYILAVNISVFKGRLVTVNSNWMALSLSDFTATHGLTTPTFAAPLTETPWSSVNTGTNTFFFDGSIYDVSKFSTTLNHNLDRMQILVNGSQNIRIQPTIRDIFIDLDVIWKDSRVSQSLYDTLTPHTIRMALHSDDISVIALDFTDVFLEKYAETVTAEARRQSKIISYSGYAQEVQIRTFAIGNREPTINETTVMLTDSTERLKKASRALAAQTVPLSESINRIKAKQKAKTLTENITIAGGTLARLSKKIRTPAAIETTILSQILTRQSAAGGAEKVRLLTENVTVTAGTAARLAAKRRALAAETITLGGGTAARLSSKKRTRSETTSFSESVTGVAAVAGPTRLYFHNATDSTSGLPTTEQSSLTATVNSDALTVNRSMNKTIGTANVTLTLATPNSIGPFNMYFTRFVSPALNMSAIAANTWTYNFGSRESTASVNFPVGPGNNLPCRVNCYVWRPSSSTKIGTILDGDTASTLQKHGSGHYSNSVAFSGSAVSGMAAGDRIIFEVWFTITQASAAVRNGIFHYDGTTITLADNVQIALTAGPVDHASFIETPEGLKF